MIIRLSVQDNDYTRPLKHFAATLMTNIYAVDNCHHINRLLQIMNPNTDDPITEDDKEFLIELINQLFDEFFKKSEYFDYLKKNFQCSIGYLFEDMWENGEAVYLFTVQRVVIVQ